MTTLPTTTRKPAAHYLAPGAARAIALALFGAFLYLLLRNAGTPPMVLADEWYYSSAARLLPFEQSRLPSYLYLFLFSTTSSCGESFYDCARVLNALLFVATAPLIYLIAQRVCRKRVAALVAALCLLAPLNSTTAYFMPEVMYFFAFTLFAWGALRYRAAPPAPYALAAGAMLGLMSVIKVHAVFLLPALCGFMLYLCLARQPRGRWLATALWMGLLALLAMAVVKLALGYAIAGEAGLTILGRFYAAHPHSNRDAVGSLAALLPGVLTSLKGHAMGLALLMGMPLATLALLGVSAQARAEAGGELRTLAVFSVLMLGAALGMTVLFTATIAGGGPLEGVRLHMRYYNFLFPLLLIVAAATLARPPRKIAPARAALVALALLGAVLYAAFMLESAYSLSFIDAPELFVMTKRPALYAVWVASLALLLALWAWRPKLAAQLFVFALLPLGALVGEAGVKKMIAGVKPGGADKAGKVVRHYLGGAATSGLLVAGGRAEVARAMFQIDNPDVGERFLAPGAPFSPAPADARREWVLVLGRHAFAGGRRAELRTADYALYRLRTVVHFVAPLSGSVLERVDGLADPEHWGAWSNGERVVLGFAAPLPRRFTLAIRGRAFGPNAGQAFMLDMGGRKMPFRLPAGVGGVALPLETDGTQRVVTITVPQPVSPRSLGRGRDDRLLGLALESIEVLPQP
ncbi:DUF7024 domain-containing protein [Massilia glaciei]|uniref:Uncharacterized protein n=1 Tax=Massilia glaciei TaxID=1524097 RepID=A0A2U2HNM9_9BURK|nr:glycosyltransferase family 39 protein [Massilia glaciei]PWF49015.1 hypothetical protein C7C56_009010 [Massilia glaciei]